MAISAPVGVPYALLQESTDQQFSLGYKVMTDDGDCYRYVKAGGTALVAGKLQQAPAIVANHQNVACAAAAVGVSTVTVTLGATAATANQYAGGYLVINDVDGEGFTYRIKSHPAAASAATLALAIEEPVEVALTTNSEACLIPNKYNGVIIMPTTFTGAPVGVAISNIASGSFGWIKTRGVVSCLNGDAALTVGSAVSPSNATAGAVENGVIAQGFVGLAYQTGVDTEYRAIDLLLD